jgi:hypothetical protein
VGQQQALSKDQVLAPTLLIKHRLRVASQAHQAQVVHNGCCCVCTCEHWESAD